MADDSGYLFLLMPESTVYTCWPILYVDMGDLSHARRCVEPISEADLPDAVRRRLAIMGGNYTDYYRLLKSYCWVS